MADPSKIAREWIEISRDTSGGRIEFRLNGPDILPRRGGYRRLELKREGQAVAQQPGTRDSMEPTGEGEWRIEGQDRLTISGSDWQGQYKIEELTDDTLVLSIE